MLVRNPPLFPSDATACSSPLPSASFNPFVTWSTGRSDTVAAVAAAAGVVGTAPDIGGWTCGIASTTRFKVSSAFWARAGGLAVSGTATDGAMAAVATGAAVTTVAGTTGGVAGVVGGGGGVDAGAPTTGGRGMGGGSAGACGTADTGGAGSVLPQPTRIDANPTTRTHSAFMPHRNRNPSGMHPSFPRDRSGRWPSGSRLTPSRPDADRPPPPR